MKIARNLLYATGLITMSTLFVASWVFLITQVYVIADPKVGWRFETSGSLLAIMFVMLLSMLGIASIYLFYRRDNPVDEGAHLIEYDRRRREKEERKRR